MVLVCAGASWWWCGFAAAGVFETCFYLIVYIVFVCVLFQEVDQQAREVASSFIQEQIT